ncbi:MAG: class I SAM-dependent RNA methyltransferase [Bdellovibrio sp.]
MSTKNDSRGASAPLVGSQVQVQIEKLAVGGAGIARHAGLVIFVPDTCAGEEVLVEIASVKKNFAEAHLVKVLTPSPHRRSPPCPAAATCGGCNWQHLTEEEQRRQKESLVFETIKKFNPQLEFEYLPIQASPRSWRYRNRIQPKFKEGSFGFFARHSHDIVTIQDCPITEETLAQKIPEVRSWIQNQNPRGLQRLEMYLTNSQEIRYGLISEDDDGIGFSQVNRFQNEDLVQTALKWAGEDQNYPRIYDLYAGSGNFTFPVATYYKKSQITGVELNPKLVERAHALTSEKRVRFFLSDVENYLRRALITSEDLVIMDPPRGGASKFIMQALGASAPRKLIYISCHPVSLARDINWLIEGARAAGSRVELRRVQAFEMFPQTDHVETIAEFVFHAEPRGSTSEG